MPRNASRGVKGFIFLPREEPAVWDIQINGESVTTNIMQGTEFTKDLCPDIGGFKVMLINADGYYSNRYSFGQTVQLFLDLVDGTTKRFEGKIDKIANNTDYTLAISGAHLTKELIDIRVNEIYEGNLEYSDILNDLAGKYLTGYLEDYTITCTLSSTDKPTFTFDEMTFWDCILEIIKKAEGEALVTDDKVIIVRDKNSNENNDEAIWYDTYIDISNLGTQAITIKNKIKVYGDDGTGLPVIYTAQDTASQEYLNALKEYAIFDNKLGSEEEVQEKGEAELIFEDSSELEGDVTCRLLLTLTQGDKIWISEPTMKIHQQSRVYRVSHRFPEEQTIVSISRVRKMAQIIKKRVDQEQALVSLTNPYKMTGSWNLYFDSEDEVSSKESNVSVSEGKIFLSSGTQGIFTLTKTLTSEITQIHLRMTGSNLQNVLVEISVDGSNFQSLTNESLNTLNTSGKKFIARVTISSISTEIDSIAFLHKGG